MDKKKIFKIVKIAGIVIFLALVVIQFIHPARNVNAATLPEDITVMYPMPDSVHQVLVRACYDCHSNNTRYPWYNNIQPVAWWLNDHISEGKRKLNFSEFGKRTLIKQAKKFRKIANEVNEGDMPLDSYTWIHKDAILTDAEKKMINDWAMGIFAQLATKIPPDSLKQKTK